MDFRSDPTGFVTRVLACLSLLLGLADAARLVGIGSGTASPIAAMGAQTFVLLAIFCLCRLFAAVGLWMGTRWGAILLGSALLIEIALHAAGSNWVSLTLTGFIFKLMLLLAIILLLATERVRVHRQTAE